MERYGAYFEMQEILGSVVVVVVVVENYSRDFLKLRYVGSIEVVGGNLLWKKE